ncbi:hypothetical protein LAC81_37690 (plasmid) [Ensifer adhaerens]|uniref:hypothetical protein n=1 Tax=Ensifer adhaerens TaxID=106592 RepID=UPI001CBD7EA1|nr:hypothetical protein [Ensifer adhaerens]MBZ7927672.1 hypothetical protein [Ensifer adhaerens]UAX98068.1 hypothetical protein LAC78_38990 [Ensifer adhaerens]UAY05449.1 hypothetical protein LAC80_37705 [Ensifer adhaerens]UAY12827.1 hypothetical protein LAC81_37690 [Ensifer adhaerens]
MEKLELQLIAHRKILTALLASSASLPEQWERIMFHLRDDLVVQDHEEDPGVVPDADFAFQYALTEEMRTILTRAEVRARIEIGGQPQSQRSLHAIAGAEEHPGDIGDKRKL